MPRQAKRKIKLTDAAIRKLESGRTWDTQIARFGVNVLPSGRRHFILRYTGRGNKQREFRIGAFGVIGVDEARRKAKILIGKIMDGEDPQWDRKISMATATTFNEVIDKYLVWAEQRHKPTSLKEVRTYCKTHIRPLFGALECRDMTRGRIQRLYDTMAGAVTVRNKAIAWSRSIWNWADRREYVQTSNPFLIEKVDASPRARDLHP